MVNRLQGLHELGYTHNDLKPDNIVIGNKDPNIIYLIDFGSAAKLNDPDGNHI